MPLNSRAKLIENILDLKSLEQKPTRDGFGFTRFASEEFGRWRYE
jgi:hypothetical protein